MNENLHRHHERRQQVTDTTSNVITTVFSVVLLAKPRADNFVCEFIMETWITSQLCIRPPLLHCTPIVDLLVLCPLLHSQQKPYN